MDFQDIILKLDRYWARQGCALLPPGAAGRADFAGPLCLAGAARRGPAPDGLPGLYRYRVLLKPAPDGARRAFLDSLRAVGIDRSEHDLRWLPSDGPGGTAEGAGWNVLLDGQPLAGFVYKAAAARASAEIVVVLERLALVSQRKRSAAELSWAGRLTYGELHSGEAA
ncbi:MAG: glycine--tRNA ligase subunit alpha [Elusimicrobiales bacterium]|nr:glycine--tRNA ligase subunit alpha [Elusimicrobiales bacterium]